MEISRNTFVAVAIAIGTIAACAETANAADIYSQPVKAVPIATAPSGWTVDIGIEARVQPLFEGSNHYEAVPVPRFDIRRAGTPVPFRSPRDGFGLGLIDVAGFRAGPVGKIKFKRKESDDIALRGLGDVDFTVEVGGFAEYWWQPWLRTRAEVRNGIGGHDGLVADLTADFLVPITSQLQVSGGPRVTFGTARAESPYFSVNAAQSALSGLPIYNAGGGVHSYGAGLQLRYLWTPRWTSYVFAEYERLTGDVGDSPLVAIRGARDQVTIGASVSYSFDVNLPF